MRIRFISSLEKCFSDESLSSKPELSSASMLKNEVFRFGLCCELKKTCNGGETLFLKINSDINGYVRVYKVEQVPVELATYRFKTDENYLRTSPGLYPDLLLPVGLDARLTFGNFLQSFVIEVSPECGAVGVCPIDVTFTDKNGTVRASERFTLEIIDALLPKQELIFTQWFYCDCLKEFYGTEAFDERHWQIIENYMKTAVSHGVNMLLTPVFTPPLDTYVGGERPTMQLVDVSVDDDGYGFDFSRLGRWIDLCDRVGIGYFEIPHFFTQWGAEHAPKIVARVNGETKRIFGWETDACSKEYAGFLGSFIPALLNYLKSKNGADRRCRFHVSDEPKTEQLGQYAAARAVVAPLLEGYPICDALSNYEFYEQGTVTHPVVAIDSIEPFIKADVPDLWGYYCCVQTVGVPNRFIAMPSARNRVLGILLYKYRLSGFLHWGYNFYNNALSYNSVNPYLHTDAGLFVPAGDAFSVYPAPDGTPYTSLRLKVFHDALQDLRALTLCERLYGREFVMSLIEKDIPSVTFDRYPTDAAWLTDLRERINRYVKKASRTEA